MAKVLVLKQGKEYIILRVARKTHVCHENEQHIIEKGDKYIEDHINYIVPRMGRKPFKKYYRNKICLRCWRGTIPT